MIDPMGDIGFRGIAGFWGVFKTVCLIPFAEELTIDDSLSMRLSSALAAACLACFLELPDPEAVFPSTDAYKKISQKSYKFKIMFFFLYFWLIGVTTVKFTSKVKIGQWDIPSDCVITKTGEVPLDWKRSFGKIR